MTCQIFGSLVNSLATDDKDPVLHRENLTIPIDMQLSEKQKTFCESFATLLESTLNFLNFDKKDEPHIFCFSENTDSENVVR